MTTNSLYCSAADVHLPTYPCALPDLPAHLLDTSLAFAHSLGRSAPSLRALQLLSAETRRGCQPALQELLDAGAEGAPHLASALRRLLAGDKECAPCRVQAALPHGAVQPTILVVDPDPAIAWTIGALMQGQCEVQSAVSTRDGIDRLAATPPALLVADGAVADLAELLELNALHAFRSPVLLFSTDFANARCSVHASLQMHKADSSNQRVRAVLLGMLQAARAAKL